MKKMSLKPFIAIILSILMIMEPVANGNAGEVLPPQSLALSQAFRPPVLRGILVDPAQPFHLNFVLDQGDDTRAADALKEETASLIKYFLASLTVPEKELWVNLSVYERDRVIPTALGNTTMGRGLILQDFILKRITATLFYPEGKTGKALWQKIYAKAYAVYGTTDIPLDLINKVWISPKDARIHESSIQSSDKVSVFIVDSALKVMLEQDYLAQRKNQEVVGESAIADGHRTTADSQAFIQDVIRDVIIPVLEKEVNEGQNFSTIRQIYHSLILATWYKQKLQKALLNQLYSNQNKTSGVEHHDPKVIGQVWDSYAEMFSKGIYNIIREEPDPFTLETVARKYFSGGFDGSKGISFIFVDTAPAPTTPLFSAEVDLAQKTTLMDASQTKPLSEIVSVSDIFSSIFWQNPPRSLKIKQIRSDMEQAVTQNKAINLLNQLAVLRQTVNSDIRDDVTSEIKRLRKQLVIALPASADKSLTEGPRVLFDVIDYLDMVSRFRFPKGRHTEMEESSLQELLVALRDNNINNFKDALASLKTISRQAIQENVSAEIDRINTLFLLKRKRSSAVKAEFVKPAVLPVSEVRNTEYISSLNQIASLHFDAIKQVIKKNAQIMARIQGHLASDNILRLLELLILIKKDFPLTTEAINTIIADLMNAGYLENKDTIVINKSKLLDLQIRRIQSLCERINEDTELNVVTRANDHLTAMKRTYGDDFHALLSAGTKKEILAARRLYLETLKSSDGDLTLNLIRNSSVLLGLSADDIFILKVFEELRIKKINVTPSRVYNGYQGRTNSQKFKNPDDLITHMTSTLMPLLASFINLEMMSDQEAVEEEGADLMSLFPNEEAIKEYVLNESEERALTYDEFIDETAYVISADRQRILAYFQSIEFSSGKFQKIISFIKKKNQEPLKIDGYEIYCDSQIADTIHDQKDKDLIRSGLVEIIKELQRVEVNDSNQRFLQKGYPGIRRKDLASHRVLYVKHFKDTKILVIINFDTKKNTKARDGGRALNEYSSRRHAEWSGKKSLLKSDVKPYTDAAMVSEAPGGIDLDPAQIDFQNDILAVSDSPDFEISAQNLLAIKNNLSGFEPVLVGLTRIQDLSLFLMNAPSAY